MGERLVAAGLSGFERVDYPAQFAVTLRQHFQRTIGILTVQFTGSVLRRLYGFLQALGNAHETRAQLDNRGFGLLARAFDLLGPDRHGT